MLHSCSRNPSCDCAPLCSYLIAIAFHRQEPDISSFLSSGFLFEPDHRLPFGPFTEWLQLEIYRGDYDKADDLLRQYIYHSTRLRSGGD